MQLGPKLAHLLTINLQVAQVCKQVYIGIKHAKLAIPVSRLGHLGAQTQELSVLGGQYNKKTARRPPIDTPIT